MKKFSNKDSSHRFRPSSYRFKFGNLKLRGRIFQALCFLVSHRSRIMKWISKRIHFCWDNQNFRENRGDQRHAGCLGNLRLRFDCSLFSAFADDLFSAFADDQEYLVGQENQDGTRMQPAAAKNLKTEEHCLHETAWEEARMGTVFHSFLGNRLSYDPRFVFPDRPNTHKRMLTRGKSIPRRESEKAIFRVTAPRRARDQSVSQISRQPLTLFVPRFVFPDRFSMQKSMQGRKTFRRVNRTLRFRAGPSSPVQCTSTVNLSFLGNHRPFSCPVSCFRTDSACIKACKGGKHSAAWIALCVFKRVPPLLYSARAQQISVFSATTDPFRASFRVSGPIQHA
jgi:hypothetical protein